MKTLALCLALALAGSLAPQAYAAPDAVAETILRLGSESGGSALRSWLVDVMATNEGRGGIYQVLSFLGVGSKEMGDLRRDPDAMLDALLRHVGAEEDTPTLQEKVARVLRAVDSLPGVKNRIFAETVTGEGEIPGISNAKHDLSLTRPKTEPGETIATELVSHITKGWDVPVKFRSALKNYLLEHTSTLAQGPLETYELDRIEGVAFGAEQHYLLVKIGTGTLKTYLYFDGSPRTLHYLNNLNSGVPGVAVSFRGARVEYTVAREYDIELEDYDYVVHESALP